MSRSMLFLLLMVGAAPGAFADPRSSMTTFVLHAWTDALGPPEPGSQFEKELLTVASDANRGWFTAAAGKLERLGTFAASPRERLLLLLFRRQLLYEQYHGVAEDRLELAGGLFLTDAAAVNGRIDAEIGAVHERLTATDRDDGAGAIAAQFLVCMLRRLPSSVRYRSFAQQLGDTASEKVAREDVETTLSAIRRIGAKLRRSGVLSARDSKALERLADAALFLGSGERDEAVCILEQMLADARSGARAAVMIALGDAYAVPDGSPFTVGTETGTADLQVTAIMMRRRLRAITPVRPGDFDRALAWYDQAEALDREADVALRRAFVEIRRDRSEAAAELGTIAARSPGDRSSRAAGAMLGILWDDRAAFDAAIADAAKSGDFSTIAAFAAMSRMIASRNVVGDLPQAAVVLEIASASLRAAGFARIAASALEDLAWVYHQMGRADAAIVRARLAYEAVAEHLKALETQGTSPDLVEFERELLKGLTAAAAMAADEATLSGYEVTTPAAGEQSPDSTDAGAPQPFTPEVSALFERLKREMPLRKELTEKTEEIFRTAIPCAERLALLAPYRKRAVEAGLQDWLLRFDVVTAVCDPLQLERTRRELEQQDFIAPIEARAASMAAAGKTDPNTLVMLRDEVGTAMLALDVFRYSRAWESFERFASRLQRALASVPDAMPLPVQTQLLLAEARLALGRHEDALSLVDTLVSHDGWRQVSTQEKVAVSALLLQGMVARCECRESSCDPAATLLARELIEAYRAAWRIQRTGVAAGDRESAAIAAIERRLAMSAEVPPDAAARVQDARGRELATTREAAGGLAESDVAAALEALPNGTTAIIYYRTFSGFIGWKVRDGHVEVRNLAANAAAIEEDAALLQRSVIDPLEDGWLAPAARLYDALIAPFEPLVPDDTLVISASGAIGGIPFEVLGRSETEQLVRRVAIVYAARLGGAEDGASTAGQGALVAGVNGDGLAHAEEEAMAVGALLRTQPIRGAAVTADELTSRLRGARYVHLTMHGVLSPHNPFESHLRLGSGKTFEAWRLFRDAPSAEIIVLSACDMRSEPAKISGDAARAGESMTFTTFVLSGNARYVLGSAWRANDVVAHRITTEFWRNIVRDGDDPPHALQRAKMSLIAAGVTHPHYFTNFVLSARSIVASGACRKWEQVCGTNWVPQPRSRR